MRPPIDGDAFEVLRRVETRSTAHTAQLVADMSSRFPPVMTGTLQTIRSDYSNAAG